VPSVTLARYSERVVNPMPIKPENLARYPADWPDIRNRILARAKMRCEICGLANGAIGQRDMQGIFRELSPAEAEIALIDGEKVIKVVLTIAHLDHTPENCADENLRAMCQQCHNRYDVNHRCDSRKVIAGQIPLFSVPSVPSARYPERVVNPEP